MKIFSRVVCIVMGALFLLVGTFGTASADGIIPWDGQGSDNLPCPQGGLWVVQAPGASTVTAWVNNDPPLTMEQQGNGAWQALSGPLPVGTTAYATYTGDVSGNTGMELSHCEGEVPTVTPTIHPSDTPTTAPSPTSTSTETSVPTPTYTNTPRPTPTSTNTTVPTATNTSTTGPSPTATNTTVPTVTNTPEPSPTSTKTVVPTGTNTPGMTPTLPSTPGPSPTPTATPPEKNTGTGSGRLSINLLYGLLGAALILLGVFFPKSWAKNIAKK